MEIKKITAISFTILGITILAFTSVELISTKLSLPPYSFETEGRYVAYGLQVYTFLFLALPLVASLFLGGYLIFPSMFRRFYTAIRVLSALSAIGGFGTTALLIGSAMVNGFFTTSLAPIFAVVGMSPFWMMAILATSVLKKNKP
ncbi:MAG: hypothetical protein H3Z50_05575 [archaeon]|nr:hypothetical protein [archaeon]MCP8305966.1 hypothetical protein [archaeon]